jgi:CRP-like cAMP-binding protein
MIKLLENLYIFRGLSDEDLSKIEAIAELESYSSGDLIFRQNDVADAFFVIQHGMVNIELDEKVDKSGHIAVATLGTGSHFGEMGFLDDQPRSASAIAASYSNILRIGYSATKEVLKSDSALSIHVYKQLAIFMCSRLRLTTLDLKYERSRNLGHL